MYKFGIPNGNKKIHNIKSRIQLYINYYSFTNKNK